MLWSEPSYLFPTVFSLYADRPLTLAPYLIHRPFTYLPLGNDIVFIPFACVSHPTTLTMVVVYIANQIQPKYVKITFSIFKNEV